MTITLEELASKIEALEAKDAEIATLQSRIEELEKEPEPVEDDEDEGTETEEEVAALEAVNRGLSLEVDALRETVRTDRADAIIGQLKVFKNDDGTGYPASVINAVSGILKLEGFGEEGQEIKLEDGGIDEVHAYYQKAIAHITLDCVPGIVTLEGQTTGDDDVQLEDKKEEITVPADFWNPSANNAVQGV